MTTESLLSYLGMLVWSGWTGLLDYLAAHVLLCLVPAFIIAGYMSAMIPKEAITRFLGPKASKWISYPAASLGGFILAVCSLHDLAAVCRYLETMRRFGSGDHLFIRRAGYQYPGDFVHWGGHWL